jgi:glycosyltransferase involved in cell wall biosynthesis
MQGADQIWVPTTWGRSVLAAHGIAADRIRIVPEGVDGAGFHAHGRRPRISARPFRFLTVAKYEQRKSIDETLEAFAQVHSNQPDLELVIKSNYFTNHHEKYNALQRKIASLGLTNVKVLWGDMPKPELADLYRVCDTFVLPTRAEGWGLPLIEAVAAGLPVITTMYSGHTEFLQHVTDSMLTVTHAMTTIDCPEYRSYYPDRTNDWGVWARPDVDSIATCMQVACREEHRLYNCAQRNSEIIRERFGWNKSVELALQTLCHNGWL